MSSHDRAAAAALANVALAADGAVIGLVLAYVAVQSWLKFNNTSSALQKIRGAPTVRVADLRSLLSSSDDNSIRNIANESGPTEGKLVIVRGLIEAKSAVDGNWRSLRPNALISHESGGQWPHSDYVVVNLDGSRHPLPLVTVYHQLQPVQASPYTFLQALFGHHYPVGLLDEEKILPLGKEVTAVGICRFQDGNPEIKSCKDLPYFLSDMTKDQIVVDLGFRTKVLLWGGILLVSLSFGILGYAIMRNWNRWKEWKQQRQVQQSRAAAPEIEGDEEAGDVPDGQLCVICLMRRRRSAFVPCGHLVCCQGCALSVERDLAPKCPVCRQTIRNSIRVYSS